MWCSIFNLQARSLWLWYLHSRGLHRRKRENMRKGDRVNAICNLWKYSSVHMLHVWLWKKRMRLFCFFFVKEIFRGKINTKGSLYLLHSLTVSLSHTSPSRPCFSLMLLTADLALCTHTITIFRCRKEACSYDCLQMTAGDCRSMTHWRRCWIKNAECKCNNPAY